MTFSDTEVMKLDRKHPTNIYNTISLIRTLEYALDILQTEKAFTVEEHKHIHTHTHTHTNELNDDLEKISNWTYQWKMCHHL